MVGFSLFQVEVAVLTPDPPIHHLSVVMPDELRQCRIKVLLLKMLMRLGSPAVDTYTATAAAAPSTPPTASRGTIPTLKPHKPEQSLP